LCFYELEAWAESICSKILLLLLDWVIIPIHFHALHLMTALSLTKNVRFQNYQKTFKGTIIAFPRDKKMLSYYQYSLWFAHLIGAGFNIFRFGGAATSCWFEMENIYGPSYTYFAAQVKKAPD
jgi:hypothetical protein